MYWLTENPWPLMLVLIGAAAVAAIVIERRGKAVGLAFLVGAALVWLIDDSVVTPSELLQTDVQAMLDGFKSGNLNSVNALISDAAPNLRETARQGMELVQLHSGFHLKDVRVTMQPASSRAVVHLRANGRALLKASNLEQQVATRWETTWEKQDDGWRLTGVKRLDLVSGQEMGILDPG